LRISALLISIFLSSCSTIVFQSDQTIPVHVTGKASHKHKVVINGEREFYLWGMVPSEQVITIDTELADIGFLSAANVKVKESITAMQWLKTIVSFGLYSPVSYEISGFGIKSIDE